LKKQGKTLGWLGTFNRSNNLVGSLPWYYRACWHQNLAQIAFTSLSMTSSSQTIKVYGGPLTISARGHWIVFVPAADLGHESCLSGFLCGIGPWSPAPIVGMVVQYTTIYLIGLCPTPRPRGRCRQSITLSAARRVLPAGYRGYPLPAHTLAQY